MGPGTSYPQDQLASSVGLAQHGSSITLKTNNCIASGQRLKMKRNNAVLSVFSETEPRHRPLGSGNASR
jgi:hypothetical protein